MNLQNLQIDNPIQKENLKQITITRSKQLLSLPNSKNMPSEQQIQEKQKYLRENIDPNFYEDFAEFFANEADGDQNINIEKYTLEQLKTIVNKFNASMQKQEEGQKHQRSFAIYQTADLQQAYNVLAGMQSNKNQFESPNQPLPQQQVRIQPQTISPETSPQNSPTQVTKIQSPTQPKKQRPSATMLLDSVLQTSTQKTISPTKKQQSSQIQFDQKFRSTSGIFEKGNIWATTANIQTQQQRKSAEFDNFWQFGTGAVGNNNPNNTKKQQFKTQSPFYFDQAFDLTNKNQSQSNVNRPGLIQPTNTATTTKKPTQPIPSFQQLTKNMNMGKKPTYDMGNVQAPSNMKKPSNQRTGQYASPAQKKSPDVKQYGSNSTKNQPGSKQIKLISQKPISQSSNLSVSNISQPQSTVTKPPTSSLASAYKTSKIPYKGQAVHKSEFKDVIKCYEASIRTQLSDNRLQIKIEKHEIIEKNFFVGDYVMYYMSVHPLNITCKRNYEDFTKLRAALARFYPGMQLPYLQKNSWFQTNAENIKKQKVMLEFFVNDLIKNPEIRNSRIFQDFLTLKEHKAIKRKFQEYAKMDDYKSLQQLCITGGKVEVVINEPQRIYHEHLDKLLTDFDDLLGRKSRLIQTLGQQFVQVNQTLSNLGKISQQLSQVVKKFNQSVTDFEIPTLEATFNIVSKGFEEWASRIGFQSRVVNKRLVPFYKYQKDNLQTLRNLITTEGTFFKTYMKRQANQGTSPSSQIYTSSNLKSVKTGILQESRNFTVLKYQLGYLSNTLCKESVRFFEMMSENFKAKWIYQAEKYNERLAKDIQFYTSISEMAR